VLVSGGHDSQYVYFNYLPSALYANTSIFKKRLIVWKEDGEIGHAFTDVLEGGINSLMLHHNVQASYCLSIYHLLIFISESLSYRKEQQIDEANGH